MSSCFTSTPEQSFVGWKNHQTGTRENVCKYDTEDEGCGTGWRSSLIGLTERKEISGTICVAGRRCGILTVASCKATSHGLREIFSLDEGSDKKLEREDNPACGDYSRKYLKIVARHKETPWKSDTARVGWNSKDALSPKGNAYSHSCISSLPSLMVRATSSPILCSKKLLHSEKVGLFNYIVDGRCQLCS